MTTYQSWGRYPQVEQTAVPVNWRSDPFPATAPEKTLLPYGQGRSYGDCCLNDGGTLLDTAAMDRFISFDESNGILRAEAGVTLEHILRLVVPKGWFLPVSPGTQYVTLGGAVANDVHGKNHHRAGTFGQHVRSLELLRSDGTRRICSPEQNVDYFKATIGGLGLTGLIVWVEFQLTRIENPLMDVEHIKFHSLDDFFALSKDSDAPFDYTVAWVDALAAASGNVRGIFMRGNHAPGEMAPAVPVVQEPAWKIPCDAPEFLLNHWTMSLFNGAFYHKQLTRRVTRRMPYGPFFYPLDAVAQWNRLYGKRGFFQFQCVVPIETGAAAHAVPDLLARSARSGDVSFLTVLKVFGNKTPVGMMSFPRPGATLCIDFPMRGTGTLALLREMDEVVRTHGGAVYPAKDACMSAQSFQTYFPRWKEFSAFIDPRFSSSFWRRVSREVN